MGERIFDRQHPAPAVAKQAEIVAIETERPAHLLDLVDEARDRPQSVVVGLVGISRAELIVIIIGVYPLDPPNHDSENIQDNPPFDMTAIAVCPTAVYVGLMEDALNLIRDRLAKAETKAARAEKAWESAKCEVADLQTALRVMSDLTGESPAAAPTASANVAERQSAIVRLLKVGEASAASPAELFEMYAFLGLEEITIDTFRTTIWRMKDIGFRDGPDLWLVKGDNGRYWKEPATMDTRARHEALVAFGRPSAQAEEIDEDVPF